MNSTLATWLAISSMAPKAKSTKFKVHDGGKAGKRRADPRGYHSRFGDRRIENRLRA